MFSPPDEKQVLSITKLNRFAKRVLESEVGLVWVNGEISNFVAAASGHWYLTLKDNKAQIRAAMFKGANQRAAFLPKNGDKVLVRGSLSIYEPRGDYQLILQHIEQDGIGALKQRYEALKLALSKQGLFDDAHKQPLPKSISKIGVVTSPSGAAIHDILQVLARRSPSTEVILYPASVQGDLAATQIVKQIEIANERNEVNVLIVGRGGGSIEDLWPFNEEIVAHAIFASKLPIVSAVGHEIDITISDFVADYRAPTPSAAAELLSNDRDTQNRQLQQVWKSLNQNIDVQIHQHQYKINLLKQRLAAISPINTIQKHAQTLDHQLLRLNMQHPAKQIALQKQRLEGLKPQLVSTLSDCLLNKKVTLDNYQKKLQQHSPANSFEQLQQHLHWLQKTMQNNINEILEIAKRELSLKSALLDSVSPLNTLKRGYSITYQDKQIIRSIHSVSQGDSITTVLHDGEIESSVKKVISKNK